MQFYRLFQIIYILLDKKQVTVKELANIFNVSTRTIYRDIDKLTLAGMPIYTNKGSDGGIFLLDNFKINKALISELEQESLLIGANVANLFDEANKEQERLITKLKAIFDKEDEPIIHIDLKPWRNSN